MSGRPTVGSLFSGIGGMDLGLERAGFDVRWQVEWDAWCQRILAKHWPNVPRFGDIHDVHAVSWHEGRSVANADDGHGDADGSVRAGRYQPQCGGCVEPVDLLAGGFPCQPFSNAGRRLGKADDRWLWPEFARLIGVLRPRLVLVENVPGLLAGHGGMGSVLGDLAALGYDAEWDCIPASAVGAPHLRYRVWVVAYAHDLSGLGIGSLFDRLGAAHVSDTDGRHVQGLLTERDDPADGCESRERSTGLRGGAGRDNPWAIEPDVGRVAHGVPSRVDRLRGLGNAVVPQVVEVIGRQLMEALS